MVWEEFGCLGRDGGGDPHASTRQKSPLRGFEQTAGKDRQGFLSCRDSS